MSHWKSCRAETSRSCLGSSRPSPGGGDLGEGAPPSRAPSPPPSSADAPYNAAVSSQPLAPPGPAPQPALTLLLGAARAGEPGAQEALYASVYGDLKRLARAQLGAHGRAGSTLATTALVHESYLRLAGPAEASIEDRRHFYNLAARVMRHVIVDRARERQAEKRGAAQVHQELSALEVEDPDGTLSIEALAVDRALEKLDAASPELARLVELRFFAGLTVEELVPLLGRSERTLKRDWRRAQAFLAAVLDGAPRPSAPPPAV